ELIFQRAGKHRPDIECPLASDIAYLDEQTVFPSLQFQFGLVLIRRRAALDVLRQYALAVEPNDHPVITAQRHRQRDCSLRLDFVVEVNARKISIGKELQVVDAANAEAGKLLPANLLVALA